MRTLKTYQKVIVDGNEVMEEVESVNIPDDNPPHILTTASHDRQLINGIPSSTISSSAFTDLPNAKLTTKNLGVNGDYLIFFKGEFKTSNANKYVEVQISVDNQIQNDTVIKIDSANADSIFKISSHTRLSSLAAYKDIKVQWRTNSGFATCVNCQLTIDGILSHNVVE